MIDDMGRKRLWRAITDLGTPAVTETFGIKPSFDICFGIAGTL